MHKLLARQLAKSKSGSGELDLQVLMQLVSEAYEQSDNDRRRTDRSISLMVDELDQLNRGLDQLVQKRTADLREREAELRAQNLRFDAALTNMGHALCMFDQDERLIVCNDRYSDMYGLTREQTKPGTSLRTILEARVEAGSSPENSKDYVQQRLQEVRNGKSYYTENELRDGRIVAVNHQPMQHGGWVAVHHDITIQKQAERQINYMARHDALTGIANRTVLVERMEEALARLHHRGSGFAVFMLDLDLFKTVNDSLGHPVGDALLKAVARRLSGCIRDIDTVARLGGDEFAILTPLGGDPREETVGATAKQLLDAVATPYDVDGDQIDIGTSIGIALAPEHGSDAGELMKHADQALYKAKAEGRGAFRFFEDAMGVEASARRTLQMDLRAALCDEENDQLELHYHPIVCIETREIISCEALVRWRHPERGMIPPGDFIPLAEETGLINPIGERVLRKACRDAATWPEHIKVSVNFSPVQFRKAGQIDMLRQVLAECGLAPERLEVEITESVLLHGNAENIKTLRQLRDLGAAVVLDDFGTGYSSLSYLRIFPFDKIKIDRSFVHELSGSPDSAAIVLAVANLGRNLGMKTVAEGIETEEQLALARTAGCTNGQGFLFGRPCVISELDLGRARNKAA
jgi:diguanylate cyclase (GGDEF)-like protein/PAS domain S-box-containing protein